MGLGRSFTLFGVVVAAAAIVIAPSFNVEGYSSVRHSISELGAQEAPGAWIMRTGFAAFGVGVLVDALRGFRNAPVPAASFVVFGVSMVLVGVFSHRPIDPMAAYSVREDDLHSLFSSAVGASFAIGVLTFCFARRATRHAVAHAAAISAAILIPLGMGFFASFEGLLQRLMFLVSFVWLAAFLPLLARAPDASPISTVERT